MGRYSITFIIQLTFSFIKSAIKKKKKNQCQLGWLHGYLHNLILDSRNPLWPSPKCSQRWLGHHHLPSLTLFWLSVTLGIKAQVYNKVSDSHSPAKPILSCHKKHRPSCLPNSHRALSQPWKSQAVDSFLLQSCPYARRHMNLIVSITLGSFLHNTYQ